MPIEGWCRCLTLTLEGWIVSGLRASFSAFFAGCVQLSFLWDVFLRVLCFQRVRPLVSKGGWSVGSRLPWAWGSCLLLVTFVPSFPGCLPSPRGVLRWKQT